MSFRKLFFLISLGRSTTLALILGILFAASVHAQVAGGSLSGTVTDPSGASVPSASVLIKNIATGVGRTLTTNADGFYSTPNLLPGEYQVTISANGFNTLARSGISMTVGAQRTLDVTMQIGSSTNQVEVTADAPAIQTTSSEIGATVNSTTVRELPLNGRSWTDLAALQPGVDAIQTQPGFQTGADRGNRGFGQQMTISGARPQQNNYRLDGISLNDYANGAPGSVLGGNLGVDAIQEFSVLTTNYSAEYGKTSGGVVNAITKSGTNQYHGSVYEFLRNSALDARNFFESAGSPKADFKKNQFGGAVGGPIIKDRTFFFADYEGIRQEKGIANLNFVPSSAARGGTLSTGNVTVDPAIKAYLALYPVPADCGQDVCPYTFNGLQVVNENFITTRIDHKFSEKDSLFGTYVFDKTPYNSPDSLGNVGLNTLSSRQILAVEETHTFTNSFANAVRFGYNHENVNNNSSVLALNPAASDTTLGAFPGRNAALVRVPGALTDMTGGVGGLPTYLYRWNSFQGYDDAFYNHGTHSIKFGVAFERMMLQVTALTDPNGIWIFPDLPSFLQNQPSKFQGGVASSLTPRDLRQNVFGAYIQDDWRWKPSLTFNLGLRYEFASVPTEINGKLANLRQISDSTPHLGSPFFSNPTLHNFEPRIGFAWDPMHNGKMAVRGGAGLFDVLPLPYQFILLTTQAAPFFQYTSVSSGSAVVQPFTCCAVPAADITPNSLRSTYVESNPKRNYVTQWNLNIQYELTPNLSAMIAYVGSRGVHQPFRVDEANLVIPQKTTAGYLWPQVDVNGNNYSSPNCIKTDPNIPDNPNLCSSPNPVNGTYSSVRGMFYEGMSYYNALEMQIQKHMSHGFQLQGTFTWAKSMDTSSATLAGDAFGNSISSLNYFDLGLTRARSDFSIGRTMVINGTWDIPSPKSWTGAAKWISDGWELGTILTVGDGVPFTPTWGTGSDPAGTLSGDDFAYPNRLSGPGCATLTNSGNPNNYIKTQCFSVPVAPNQAFWTANCSPAPPSLGYGFDPLNPGNPVAANNGNPAPAFLPALACFNLRGNSGRNILTGPGITDMDFSIFKNNNIRRISETFNVQFRVEMFNILNRPNFAPPGPGDGNTDIFAANGTSLSASNGGLAGVLQRTTIPERQIQFAMKIIF